MASSAVILLSFLAPFTRLSLVGWALRYSWCKCSHRSLRCIYGNLYRDITLNICKECLFLVIEDLLRSNLVHY